MTISLRMVLVVLLWAGSAFGGEVIDRIVAVVNDEAITSFELDREVDAVLSGTSTLGPVPGAADRQALRTAVLDRLIERELMRQRARELNLEAGQAEIDAAVQDVLKQNRLTLAQLTEALAAQGISMEEYRRNLGEQITRFKLLGREVQSRTEVTREEIRAYFREHIDDYREGPAVALARLTFRIPERASAAEVEAVRGKAEEARERLASGKDFHAVLLGFATDRTVEGEELGTFAEQDLSSLYLEAIRGLGPGEPSALLESGDTFTLLVVTERSSGSVRQFDEVSEEIRARLIEGKSQKQLEIWQEQLREQAHIDIRL